MTRFLLDEIDAQTAAQLLKGVSPLDPADEHFLLPVPNYPMARFQAKMKELATLMSGGDRGSAA